MPAADVRAAVLSLRRSKGMVLDDADPDTWSAGSFFTNPVLDAAAAAALPEGAPRYAQPDGRTKTSAAWLIEHAGFGRGWGDGPARVSTKHTLALTNRGAARAGDVLELARRVRIRGRAGVRRRPGARAGARRLRAVSTSSPDRRRPGKTRARPGAIPASLGADNAAT